MFIPRSRSQDIILRGKNYIVRNSNGMPVRLESAKICFNNFGDYIQPSKYIKDTVDNDECCLDLFGFMLTPCNMYS